MAKYKVDHSFLNNISNEEIHAIKYHLYGTCYLANYLLTNDTLRKSELYSSIQNIINYWSIPAKYRNYEHEQENLALTLLFGLVGKALFFIDNPTPREQLLKELTRFCNDHQQFIGNYFLFYIAGLLASQNYTITFLPEEKGLKTPDIRAAKNNSVLFIECNARQPQNIIDNQQKIRQQIKALIEEKLPKFEESRFHPGVITGEVTPVVSLLNNDGKQTHLQLLHDTVEYNQSGQTLFHLERDPDWLTYPYNQNTILKHLVEEFALQDSRNNAAAVYLAIVRQIYKSESSYFAPRAGLLLLDSREDPTIYTGLSNQIYIINKNLIRKQLGAEN